MAADQKRDMASSSKKYREKTDRGIMAIRYSTGRRRGEGSGGGKLKAEWVEGWKSAAYISSRRWCEASEPGAGEHSCGSPWALWLPSSRGPSAAFTGPREAAGASQSCGRVGRLGQPSQDRGRNTKNAAMKKRRTV